MCGLTAVRRPIITTTDPSNGLAAGTWALKAMDYGAAPNRGSSLAHGLPASSAPHLSVAEFEFLRARARYR